MAIVPLLFAPAIATAASSDSFEDRCEHLGSDARISVVFEDKQVSRSYSRSIAELKGLSGARSNQYHSIFGLTHAVPSAKLATTPNMLTDKNGRTCAVPSIVLTLGFSEFDVYLAKELKDPCRRRIVDDHENEHVGVWRNYFRAGAKLLETPLRNTLMKPMYFSSRAEAITTMRHHVEELVSALLKNLKDDAVAANQQIDSPASYQFEASRMLSCP